MVFPDNIEAVRTRLASRTSFFGGSISTRDNARVASWKDLPSVKAATAGRNAAKLSELAPPRLKLTTAAAETASGNPTASKIKGNKGYPLSKATGAGKATTTTTAAATAAAASALMHRTPPEPLKKNTTPLETLEGDASKPKNSRKQGRSSTDPAPPTDNNNSNKGTMLRHQQMTSLGIQTVQLICIPTQKTQKKSTLVEQEHQNVVPAAIEKNLSNEKATAASFKPIAVGVASPRRQHATLSQPLPIVKPKIKQRLKGTFYGSAQPPAARHRIRTVDDESDSDLDSFIDTDDDDDDAEDSESDIDDEIGRETENNVGNDQGNNETQDGHIKQNIDGSNTLPKRNHKPKKWKRALKEALNGYDASKFAQVDAQPDRRMHASYEEILDEEARAGKIGRAIDRVEAEKEATARAAEKEERRRKENERRKHLILEDTESSSTDDDDVLSESSDDEGENDGGAGNVEKRVRKRRKKLAGFLASF